MYGLPTFPLLVFVWLFCQQACNRHTFHIQIWASPCTAMLVQSLPMNCRKRPAHDTMYLHICQTCQPRSWRHRLGENGTNHVVFYQLSSMIQTHERLKLMLFIRTKRSMHVFRVIPFIKLQNDTSTTAKQRIMMKTEMESSDIYPFLAELCCFMSGAWKTIHSSINFLTNENTRMF